MRGGDTRYAGCAFMGFEPEDKEIARGYIAGIVAPYVNQDVVDGFVNTMVGVPQWLNDRGCNIEIVTRGSGGCRDIDGWDHINRYLHNRTFWNPGMYNTLIDLLETLDNVGIWYGAPAVALLQDPQTRVVEGVTVEVSGERHNVRALDGVVICTGGMLADQDMVRKFMHLPECYPKGSTLNTGDGIKLAQTVGADLWNLTAADGPTFCVVDEATGQSYCGGAILVTGVVSLPNNASTFIYNSAIVVGPDGTRAFDEVTLGGYGYVNFHGRYDQMPLALPAYALFDQAAFDAVPIYPIWGTNDDKLKEGVIVSAETLDELAEMLGMPEGSLSDTVATYNGYCADGEDPEFGRPADYLVPISETGPYYAVEFKPTAANSQGGPRHNGNAEIVDPYDNPIPHLYGAGDCGSMWADRYQGGSNLAECLAYGIIAGTNAATKKTDNIRESLMGDRQPVDFTEPLPSFEPEAENEYVGRADSIGGPIWVKVTTAGDAIASVEVLYNNETPNVGSKAIEQMPGRIVEAQSIEVDNVTGATSTSVTIKQAILNALEGTGISVGTTIENPNVVPAA